MPAAPLRAAEAARTLGVPTLEVLQLIRDRKIRYVMVDGIAHIPADAIDEYRRGASFIGLHRPAATAASRVSARPCRTAAVRSP